MATIRVEQGGGAVTVERRNGGWAVAERDGYRAAEKKVRSVLLGLAQLELIEPKTRKPELHEKLYLRDPDEGRKSRRLTLLDAGGQEIAQLIVGMRKVRVQGELSDGLYIRKPGDPQTWAADRDIDVDGDEKAWLDRTIIDLEKDRVRRVEINHADGERTVVTRSSTEDEYFDVEDVPVGKALVTEGIAHPTGHLLSKLKLDDVHKEETVAFDENIDARARFSTFDGIEVTLEVAEVDGQHWLRVLSSVASTEASADAEKEAEVLASRTQGWVYLVPSYKADALRKRITDFVKDAEKTGS